jgi:RNA polymerase sigma factor (sigma-70 family)
VKEEFAKLVSENQDIIHKVCNLYCNNAEDKRDLFQDVLYQLWKSYPSFRSESKFTTWMYRVALNTAITRFKKFKKTPKSEEINERIIQVPDLKDDVLEEKLKALYSAINQLSKIERAIIMLHLEENSYQEIAQIMGITETNVGVKINRIKKKLKTILMKQEALWN